MSNLYLKEYNPNNIETICVENHFHRYLMALHGVKNKYGVALVVRDTPGSKLPEYIVDEIKKIGFSNFEKTLWNCYVGLIISNKVICNNKGAKSEEPVSFNFHDDKYDIELISEPWRNGNRGIISINGVNYSNNMRGINIVVFDPSNGKVIDSVGFDGHQTYVATSLIHMAPNSIEESNYDKLKSLLLVQNQKIDELQSMVSSLASSLEGSKKANEKLSKDFEHFVNMYNVMYWSLFKKEEESSLDAKKRFFMNMKEAEGVLRIAQRCESIILKEVHRVCEDNDIKYWINFGTLIGAARHANFIPWDDDIDICMTRDELPKFEEAMKNHDTLAVEHYYNYSWDGMIHYVRVVFKDIRNVFVDIFIYDVLSDDTAKGEETFKTIRNNFRAKTKKAVYPVPKEYVDELDTANKEILERLYNGKDKKAIYWSIDNYTQNIDTFLKYDDVFPLKKMVFDGYQVYAPNNVTQVLNDFYGDYLSIPSDVGAPKHLKYTQEELEKMKEHLK